MLLFLHALMVRIGAASPVTFFS